MCKKLTEKGDFQNIDKNQVKQISSLLTSFVSEFKKITNQQDICLDTILNEFQDSFVALELGFSQINKAKHGFDAKQNNNNNNTFLESKCCSWNSNKNFSATFNDTTIEKANFFKDENNIIALSVWKDFKCLFIVYGSNKNIGEWLEKQVEKFLNSNGSIKRSTQTISYSKLLNDFNFKIRPVEWNQDKIQTELKVSENCFDKKYKNISKTPQKN